MTTIVCARCGSEFRPLTGSAVGCPVHGIVAGVPNLPLNMTPSPTAPHSPTPWEIVSTETSRPRTRGWKEIRSGRSPVVDVDSFDVHSGGETETHCGVRISDANAALIVRAVNSHEGLVRCRDALRDVLEAWDMLDYPEDDGGYTIAKIDAVYSRARAALAEAGEECL